MLISFGLGRTYPGFLPPQKTEFSVLGEILEATFSEETVIYTRVLRPSAPPPTSLPNRAQIAPHTTRTSTGMHSSARSYRTPLRQGRGKDANAGATPKMHTLQHTATPCNSLICRDLRRSATRGLCGRLLVDSGNSRVG